jgi:PAS domain S-box-containing protein
LGVLRGGAADIVRRGQLEGAGAAGAQIIRDAVAGAVAARASRDALATAEALGKIADTLGEVLWLTSADLGRIIYVSPAAERVWGRPPSILREGQQHWFATIHPDDIPRIAERVATKPPASAFSVEYRVVHPSGAIRWVRSRAFPVLDAADCVQAFAGLTEDVTEQTRVREELEETRGRALEAAQVKTNFVGNLSHELRTPVNGIVGMTEVLRGTPLTAEQRGYTDTILGCAESLIALVDDLLDFSSIDAERIDLASSPFGLRAEIDAVIGLMTHPASHKGLRLVCDVAPEVPDRLRGDAQRVRQVLLNLVSNAIKFTESGTVRLAVDCAARGSDDAILGFTVRDTGIGIPADRHAAIFEPFVQVDGSTTRRFGGTGLGLAICARLVALMGGRIEVESDVGRGSTFSFRVRFRLEKSGADVLDRQQLMQRIGDDPEILLQLVAVFREECRMLLTQIEQGLAARDTRVVERAAHRLRGSLGTMAAEPAQQAALEVELLGRAGDLGTAAERFRALAYEVERLEPALAALTATN